MTNKLVVIINSLKVPKIKKILLYEMKFLVPNYSYLQNPVLSVLCPQLNLFTPRHRTKFLVTPLLRDNDCGRLGDNIQIDIIKTKTVSATVCISEMKPVTYKKLHNGPTLASLLLHFRVFFLNKIT